MLKVGLLVLLLCVADTSPRARRFTPETLGLLRSFCPHKDCVYDVAFSRHLLATAGTDGGIVLTDTRTWREVRVLRGHAATVRALAFHPDGSRLVSASLDGTARVWDTAAGREVLSLEGHGRPVYDAAFSPDGRTIATAGGDNTVRTWDARWGQALQVMRGHLSYVQAVAFSPDGALLASASYDGSVRIWETTDGGEVRSITCDGRPMMAVAFSPDGRTVYAGGMGKTAYACDASSGRVAGSMQGHEEQVSALAVIHGGRVLVSCGGSTVRLWDARTRALLGVLSHHTAAVHGLAVSWDHGLLASASADMQVKIWGYVPGGMKRIRPKGFLGITLAEGGEGPIVRDVYPATAAEACGLRAGDVIRGIAGEPMRTVGEAISRIGIHFKGDEVEIKIRRSGTDLTMKATLGQRPDDLH